MKTFALLAAFLAALLLGAAGAHAQQPGGGATPAAPAAGSDPAAALVKKITADLAAVDKALSQASDGDAVKKTLDEARASHGDAIRDIEELLKQVKYTKSNKSRSQGGAQDPGSQGGVTGKPPPRENDASTAPTPQKGKSQQDQAEQQQQEQAAKGAPRDPGKNGERPEQAQGQQPPPADPLGRFQRTDTDARWGLLPPKLQERLMNLHVDDVPERYRTWLESYIHALNRIEEQGGGRAAVTRAPLLAARRALLAPLALAVPLVLGALPGLPGTGVAAAMDGAGIAAPAAGGAAAGGDRLQLQRVQELVSRGHTYLIEQQNADGSFSIERSTKSKSAPVAVTALTALSLMAAGNLPDRGRYEVPVRRAVEWLVDHCNDDGYFTTDRDGVSRMHGQGYALLALTQAWGMYDAESGQRERMRAAIERGIGLIADAQGDTGGWYYDPRRVSDHEGSITVCMVQALRAARDAGFHVSKGVIDRALVYLEKSQDKSDGRFRYRINDPKKSWALTAAAMSTLNALGDYDSETLQLGFDALQRSDPVIGQGRPEPFQDYGSLYAAQAYWHWRDSKAFDLWWPEFVAGCAEHQQADGSFFDGDFGSVYATAIVTLTLQVPLGCLPIFQR